MRTGVVDVPSAETVLTGDLAVPEDARGAVIFAHGSGSDRHSPRNRTVAAGLNHAGLGTLLVDLFPEDERRSGRHADPHRFEVGLLSRRLTGAVDWLAEREPELPIGLFGASTGAAIVLATAVSRPDRVRAVVSRGGRPDLASPILDRVRAPVLLLVGGRDETVLEVNHAAARLLRTTYRVKVVPGATHLFEEPGALDEVASAAADWFLRMRGDGAPHSRDQSRPGEEPAARRGPDPSPHSRGPAPRSGSATRDPADPGA